MLIINVHVNYPENANIKHVASVLREFYFFWGIYPTIICDTHTPVYRLINMKYKAPTSNISNNSYFKSKGKIISCLWSVHAILLMAFR